MCFFFFCKNLTSVEFREVFKSESYPKNDEAKQTNKQKDTSFEYLIDFGVSNYHESPRKAISCFIIY